MTDPAFGPDEFRVQAKVSRETVDRLAEFVALLTEWSTRHNLVSRASLGDAWNRHLWDSAQLAEFVPPAARTLVDLGSGAGFPGLILALLLRERQGFHAILFEATRKKADFLAIAARRLGVDVEIRNARIEAAPAEPCDVVTARACAPLSRLLEYAQRFQAPQTTNLLLKGQNVGDELTEAHKIWNMSVEEKSSHSDPSGVVLVIRNLQPRRSPAR